MSEEEFINNVGGHITSLKNLDNKALKILVAKLEEENKKLKEEKEIRALNDRDNLIQIEKLEKENKKLKGENEYRKRIADVVPKGKGHIAEETIQDLQARIKELKEENEELKEAMKELNNYNKFRIQENKKLKEELKRYKKLHKYSNGELLTYSGD